MATRGQVGVDPLLDRRPTELPQALCFDPRERGVSEIGERLATPQSKRLSERLRSVGAPVPRALDESPETVEIELVRLDSKEIARAASLDTRRAEGPPQTVHCDLEGIRGRFGRVFTPEPVDQPLTRHDFVRVQQQQGEERTLPRAADDEPILASLDLQRAEQAEPQLSSVVRRRSHGHVLPVTGGSNRQSLG